MLKCIIPAVVILLCLACRSYANLMRGNLFTPVTPAPEEFTAAPVAADVNKYIIMKGVEVADGEFTTASATNLNLTIGEETVVLRNAFKLAASFDATKKYDVVGAVAIYNGTLQVYFISAEEHTATALTNTAIETKAVKTIENGMLVIEKAGVRYNVLGQIVR